MQYFVLPIILYIFSVFSGELLLKKLNFCRFRLNGILGFSFILAALYILYFPLVLIDANILVLVLVTFLFFGMVLFFVIKNFRAIKPKLEIKEVLLFFSLIVIQLYFASRNTIGSLWRYDTISYTNMISGSIYGTTINTIDWYNGFGSGFIAGYSFQSYYKLASVLYYSMNAVCNVLKINFFYFTQHTWMYTLVLYMLSSEMIINVIDLFKIKSYGIKIGLILFFIFFMGNFYWNSEQAYLGNSFRMIMTSYCIYYLSRYFKEKDNKYLKMLIIFNYANCACANSNSTLTIIITFFVWAFSSSEKNTLKYFAISLYLPLINCAFQVLNNRYIQIIVLVTVFLMLAILFEKHLMLLINKLKLKYVLPVFVGIALLYLSYKVTGKPLDTSSFINNWSGWSDMTWDYTDFSTVWRSMANISYISLMIFAYIRYRKNTTAKLLLMVTLIFFNPFAQAIQEAYMPVYYRNYDIVINYFTLSAGFKALDEFGIVKIKYILTAGMIVLFGYIGYEQFTYHPNSDYGIVDGFEKSEGYNKVLNMNNDTADTLLFLKDYLVTNNIRDGKVISSIAQFRTEFPYMKTLYNRSKKFNGLAQDYELYKIFYPDDYYGDINGYEDVDYDNIYQLINDSDYMLIVQDSSKIIYNKETESYHQIRDLLNEYYSPIYTNDTYSVYRVH